MTVLASAVYNGIGEPVSGNVAKLSLITCGPVPTSPDDCIDNLDIDPTAVPAQHRNLVYGVWDQHLQRYLLATPREQCTHNVVLWEFQFKQNAAKLFRRTQAVSCMGFFYRDYSLTPDKMPPAITPEQLPFSPGDPVLLSSRPVLVSGSYEGNVYEHEVTTDDNGIARTSTVTFGPLPKDPVITGHMDKRLAAIRFRGRKYPNTVVNVFVRPIHTPNWTQIGTLDLDSRNDESTIKVDGDGISGEQFYIKLEETALFSVPRIYSITLYGTHTGAFRKE